MLRPSDDLANGSFCWLDISRVQLKYNRTVSESLLDFAQEAVTEWRINLLKVQWISLERVFGWCHVVTGELLRLSNGLVNWSFCLSDISRVQLKFKWTVGKRLLASDSKTVWKSRLILSKLLLNFFNGWFRNSSTSKELSLKEPLDNVMLRSGISSDPQMALRINHFVDRTFRGSNWSPTEQMVKVC